MGALIDVRAKGKDSFWDSAMFLAPWSDHLPKTETILIKNNLLSWKEIDYTLTP